MNSNDKTLFIIYLQNSKHIGAENLFIYLKLSFSKLVDTWKDDINKDYENVSIDCTLTSF